ncbi:unnamed protein product, partial [marine sediment metagenome]
KNRIYNFLRERPGKQFSDSEIQRALQIGYHSQVNTGCRQLAGEGKITRREIGGTFKNYYQNGLEPDHPEPPEDAPPDPGFSLERDLESFIFEDIDSVEDGLKPYRGESGRQYTVESRARARALLAFIRLERIGAGG